MKRAAVVIATCLTVVLLAWPASPAAAQKGKGDAGKVKKLMQEKLKNSQRILEGLTLADYDKVTKCAEELIQLTKTEEWHVFKTPRYQTHSDEFRRTAENVIQKAKMKNVDALTLAYFEMTLSCVRCHEYVREVRDVDVPDRWSVLQR